MVQTKKIFFIIGALILIGFSTYYIPRLLETKSCGTEECFISSADLCEEAAFSQEYEGGTNFMYYTKDCIMIKSLINLGSMESPELKSLLEGKSLSCTYDKGNFDKRWMESLSKGLENCDGELKDLIYQLSIFV